jgi:hypothetical protein
LLEDYTLSPVRDCLFNIFTAALHIGGHSSIHNLRMLHAVVTGTHLYSSYNFKEGINTKIKELKFTERVGSEESHCIKNGLLRYLDTAVTKYIYIYIGKTVG